MQLKVVVDGIEYTPIVKLNTWKLPEYENDSEWVATGFSEVTSDYYNRSTKYTEAGRRRATKELAERCAKMSKQRDLLEAWRDHLDPEWVDKEGYTVHYIYYSYGEYKTGVHASIRAIGTIYGSKETMQMICNALNNKEISLD